MNGEIYERFIFFCLSSRAFLPASVVDVKEKNGKGRKLSMHERDCVKDRYREKWPHVMRKGIFHSFYLIGGADLAAF